MTDGDASGMQVRQLYCAAELPVLQNRTFDTAAAARQCPRGDLNLVQDLHTGLIFNEQFRAELVEYDSHYQNEQALSGTFQRHLQQVAEICRAHFSGMTLVEVGCGKGYFLERLQALGFAVTGLDPAYEGSNPAIRRQYFDAASGIRADGIVLRHVLEHVREPLAFLAQLCRANAGHGRIYIEVPCFDWICERRAWFDIFYEHVNYFRDCDFRRMFGVVHETGRLFGGQYLYVVAELASLRVPGPPAALVDFPADFLAGVERCAQRLRSRPGRAAVWGGASKGVLFTLFMRRCGVDVDVVFDINPAKHGRYLPVSGARVYDPAHAPQLLEPGADVFVMNGNYLDEIRALTDGRFNYQTVDHAGI